MAISVACIKSLGLTVVSKPISEVAGHVVIPELNASAYQANKSRFTSVKLALAEEASRPGNILVWPEGLSPRTSVYVSDSYC